MGFNGKHLSLEDRKIIENNIGKGLRNNRKRKYYQREDLPSMCNHFKKCKVFTSICKDSREGVNLNTTERFELDYIIWIVNSFLDNFYKDTFLYSIGVK